MWLALETPPARLGQGPQATQCRWRAGGGDSCQRVEEGRYVLRVRRRPQGVGEILEHDERAAVGNVDVVQRGQKRAADRLVDGISVVSGPTASSSSSANSSPKS